MLFSVGVGRKNPARGRVFPIPKYKGLNQFPRGLLTRFCVLNLLHDLAEAQAGATRRRKLFQAPEVTSDELLRGHHEAGHRTSR